MAEVEKFEVGQQVLVTRRSYVSTPEWEPGEIVKVGRTLLFIRIGGHREPVCFRMTGSGHNGYDHYAFRTLPQHEAEQRTKAAMEVLRRHDLGPISFRKPGLPVETLEALAAVLTEHETKEV